MALSSFARVRMVGRLHSYSTVVVSYNLGFHSSGHHAIAFIGYDKIVLAENIAEVWQLGKITEQTQYELSKARNPELVDLTNFGIRVSFQRSGCRLIKLFRDPRANIYYSAF